MKDHKQLLDESQAEVARLEDAVSILRGLILILALALAAAIYF